MMESVFSFLPSSSIIFLAKGKISKSVLVCQSYRAKMVMGNQTAGLNKIYLQNKVMKSTNSLYTFYLLIPEIKS